MLFHFNLIKTREQETHCFTYIMVFSLLSHFDSWSLEVPQHWTVCQCCMGLWLSRLDLGFKDLEMEVSAPFFDGPPAPPGEAEQPFHRLWVWRCMKVRNFLFWMLTLREIKSSTCYDIWQFSLTISIYPLTASKYLMLLMLRISKVNDIESSGQKLWDLELKVWWVNSLYLIGTSDNYLRNSINWQSMWKC